MAKAKRGEKLALVLDVDETALSNWEEEKEMVSQRRGLDGIVAKRDDMDYRSGKHDGMQKIKK